MPVGWLGAEEQQGRGEKIFYGLCRTNFWEEALGTGVFGVQARDIHGMLQSSRAPAAAIAAPVRKSRLQLKAFVSFSLLR